MKQPRKDVLREQLALAADRIIALETVLCELADGDYEVRQSAFSRRVWWRRWFA